MVDTNIGRVKPKNIPLHSYKNTAIVQNKDMYRNEMDKYNELAFQNSDHELCSEESDNDLSDHDLKSYKAIDDEEYPTILKQKDLKNF
jgi:hypothetical protein